MRERRCDVLQAETDHALQGALLRLPWPSPLSETFDPGHARPLQVAYFLSWPVLGSAVLKVWSPNKAEMEQASSLGLQRHRFCAPLPARMLAAHSKNPNAVLQELRRRGLDSTQIEANRRLTSLQLQKLQQVAGEAKAEPGWPEATSR